MQLYGIDFTSAPRPRKPITIACGTPTADGLRLDALLACADWTAFEDFLRRPGPWLGAFDLPFGLPREAVVDLGWPQDWAALVEHCAALGRDRFRAALDAYRETRPPGRRYAHRAADGPAGSHSPLKLVNPPVGLMFLEGAPRLLRAGLALPALRDNGDARIALEAYPGALARAIERAPYKSDDRHKQTDARRDARIRIATALCAGAHPLRLRLDGDSAMLQGLIEDASGDQLDAALALVQAAWAWRAGPPRYGLPAGVDPLEGWIVGTAELAA